MREYCLDGYAQSTSPHYCYYYKPGIFAAQNIETIKQVQEESYQKIVRFLDVKPSFPIWYVLCETSEEVGRVYGDDEPCNGFADLPDTVFAVYSETVKCIGPHEDTHLIASLLARPSSVFVREGLAMYMDEKWWGKSNTAWVKAFLHGHTYPGLEKLFDNESFWSYPDEFTYPIAGAFTLWLIEKLGMPAYLERIYQNGDDSRERIENALGASISQVDEQFCDWVLQLPD